MGRKRIWLGVGAVLVALTALTVGCGGSGEEDWTGAKAPRSGSGSPSDSETPTATPTGTPSGTPRGVAQAGKRVLFIVAKKDFQDLELNDTRTVLTGKGYTVTVASSTLNEITGMEGAKERPAVLVANARAADYDAVVFIGGEGANEYFDNAAARTLAKDASAAGKVVAAICIAPSTLARADLLRGKRATCDYGRQQDLKDHGATVVDSEDVVRDGKIITGNGPYAAKKFGEEIAKALAGN